MTYKYYLIVFITLVFVRCAEVGSLSGGIKDEVAPKIIKSSIQNGAANFKSQSIEFVFDEFVQLYKPSENIFLVPKHARLASELFKKTLKINLSNDLEPNTTYTLFFNKAIKDVTEGNDSLMQFTFSTGQKLDSLTFSVRTIDAYSGQIKSKITVGLFDSLDADKPYYFGQSNQNGLIRLSAIKEGTYFCKAFEDKNEDLQIQTDEAQDWCFEPIVINGSSIDTLNVRLSVPIQPDKIKNVKLLPPGLIGIHVPRGMEINIISINGENYPKENFCQPKDDSLQIAIGNRTENEFKLTVNSDTFNLRRFEKNKMVPLKPTIKTAENETSNISHFEVMDFIESIDTSKLEVLKLPDSLKANYAVYFEKNQLKIEPREKTLKKYSLTFKDDAIKGISGKTNAFTILEISTKEDRELGSLSVKLSHPMENGIVQILDKERVIDEQKTNLLNKPITFIRLNPGDYSFRIIEDLNQNGQWDSISIENRQKAERIFQFYTPVKVRANWEVETILELKL